MKSPAQGRTPSQLLKAEAERWVLFRIVFTCLCVLLLVAAGGCAEVPRVYVQGATTYHEGDISPCGRGIDACTIGSHVYYRTGDLHALAHERDHVAGMKHAEWMPYGYQNCARITASGNTGWHVGKLICRRADGSFFERDGA